ncbi:MAG: hypothetical protein JWO94_3117, partial [Verrucomicrobiaceae bacterium]|nr:hypothetical protein [Verrucomicrobiaceae bacterium]
MKTCLCLLLTVCLGAAAHANMSAMASGNGGTGTLFATDSTLHVIEEHPTASLQHEELHIRLYDSYATVDLTYQMRNKGPATKAIAGFPSITAKAEFDGEEEGKKKEAPPAGTRLKGQPKDLEGYTITLNGKAVSSQLYAMGQVNRKGPKSKAEEMVSVMRSSQWLVSELPLAANSMSTIHITYRCPYEVSRCYISDDGTIS